MVKIMIIKSNLGSSKIKCPANKNYRIITRTTKRYTSNQKQTTRCYGK